MPPTVPTHYWQFIDPSLIVGAPPQEPGLQPGHARSKHGVSVVDQASILNAPDRVFNGRNKNGRDVDLYYKDGSVVITVAGQKAQVITCFGIISKKGPIQPVDPDKWAQDPQFTEITK